MKDRKRGKFAINVFYINLAENELQKKIKRSRERI